METKLIRLIGSLLFFMLSFGSAKSQVGYKEVVSYNGETEISAVRSVTLKSGFTSQGPLHVFVTGGTSLLATKVTRSKNFVLTRTFRDSIKIGQINTVRTSNKENQSIEYLDGLGRPVQEVGVMASPEELDIVRHIEYDSYGREPKVYLPYAEDTSYNGSFKVSAKISQTKFYGEGTGWDPDVSSNLAPYSVKVMEKSPIGRVEEMGFPGTAWQPSATRTASAGRTVVNLKGANAAGEVRSWIIKGDSLIGTAFYSKGTLKKNVVKDENWVSGNQGTDEEFIDLEGKTVLKRIWKSNTESLDTYFVYNETGDLRYVMPPALKKDKYKEADPEFLGYAYLYRYDPERRLVEKKIPGKGWDYLIYNTANLVVLTQDANQRAKGEWSFVKYDGNQRVANTGVYRNTLLTTRSAAQTAVNAHRSGGIEKLYESRDSGPEYTNLAFPVSGNTILTVNYYDDYTFSDAGTTPFLPSGIIRSTKTKGLTTGVRVNRVDGTEPLLSVFYYDEKARMIQSREKNHLGGMDIVTNTYSFGGENLVSKREHTGSSIANATKTILVSSHTYDHQGRLVDTRLKVNSQNEIIQSRFEYNGLGQLTNKKVHSENGGTSFLNSISYSYNERGWSTGSTSSNFTQRLDYNKDAFGNTIANAQFNGNIAKQHWGHGQVVTGSFTYTYDRLNRLVSGTNGSAMTEIVSYDDMGNILSLKRDNQAAIVYSYENGNKGNRLIGISGGLTGSFSYDANGNSLTDRSGMIFSYNHLNLPKSVGGPGTNLTLVYDAIGNKLKKTSALSGVTIERDYISGIEYNKQGSSPIIEMISTGDGYLQNNSGTYTFHYYITDHLGNVRTVYKRGTSSTVPEIVQKQDYYPFGKAKALVTGGINHYLYNGKERLSEIRDQLDYGARFYDPEIGRWKVVDPLSEKYGSVSPYAYALNDPIYYIDPNGMEPDGNGGDFSYHLTGNDARSFLRAWQTFYSPMEDMDYVRLPTVHVYASRFEGPQLSEVMENSVSAYWAGKGYTKYIASSHQHLFGPNPYRPWGGPQTAKEWEQVGDIIGSTEIPGLAQLGDAISFGSNIYQGNVAGSLLSLAAFVPGGSQTKLAAKTISSGASLSTNGVKLSQHLGQLEKYGAGGFKELANGRFRYYGQATLNRGDANSFRMVREWNPATGGKRTWFETINQNGGVIQIRPEFGTGVKTHYLFNGTGGYLGKW